MGFAHQAYLAPVKVNPMRSPTSPLLTYKLQKCGWYRAVAFLKTVCFGAEVPCKHVSLLIGSHF